MPKLGPGEKITARLNQKAMGILWDIAKRIKQQEQETKTKDAS
jgi:hypothetical protein